MNLVLAVVVSLLGIVLVAQGAVLRHWHRSVPVRGAVRGVGRGLACTGRVSERVVPAMLDGLRVLVRALPAVLGGLVVLVLVDWGIGATWDRVTGSAAPPAGVDLAARDLPTAEDARVDDPAMADAPWAGRYFAELESLDFTYVPFVGPREAPVHGRYVTSADGIRRSYEPPASAGEGPAEVWFFGGSALWGEGQRDLHTIPSEVSRLAESAGIPLHVVNFGIRGYTALQELLVFEQEAMRRGPPDLAVFYHGFNELSTQTEAPANLSEQPTIFQLETTEEAMRRAPTLPGEQSPGEPSVGQEYRQTSAFHKLWRNLRQMATVPSAGADEPFYVPPPEQMAEAVDHAEAIYRRTMAMVEHVAGEHDVPLAVFWQPANAWAPYDDLTERVAHVAGGIDLSGALSDPPAPVYIDGVHTNELGARLVAEAMWPALADHLTAQSGS